MSTRPQCQATDHGHAPPGQLPVDPEATRTTQGETAVTDRRRFVRAAVLGGAAVAAGAAAVPLIGAAASAQTTTTNTLPPTIPASDVKLVNYATGLELAASQVYSSMATTGKVVGIPLDYMRQFVNHHADHATALATLAAKDAVSKPNAKLLNSLLPQIANAPATQLFRIAFQMEESMAATHQELMATLTNWQSGAVVSSLEPVEAQHAVVWGQMLNLPVDQWIPPFQNTQGAYDPATYAPS
jgi:hypothetical protein